MENNRKISMINLILVIMLVLSVAIGAIMLILTKSKDKIELIGRTGDKIIKNYSTTSNTENKYYIDTAQDLWDFAEEVNNGNTFEGVTVYLTADIGLGCNENNQWVPIGDYNTNTQNIFKGIFDGQNHSISGIYINTDKRYQGLFGNNAGTIKNLKINEGQIINSNSYTGSIAGYNTGEIIEIISEISINGGDNAGGICGRNYGYITSCQNKGIITGLEEVTGKQLGGITGFNGGNIISSSNIGIINGNESEGLLAGVGGIAGYNSGKIKNCNNNAGINNPSNTGGIVGLNYDTIIDCTNSGDVIGEHWIGGIVGDNDYSTNTEGYAIILNCSNSGNIKSTLISGTSYAGGIAGSSSCGSKVGRVVIIKCQNTGLIEGSEYLGGICGFNGDGNGGATSYIKKCSNLGNVKSYLYNSGSIESIMSFVGGIVGCNNTGYIEECYNKGNIEGLNIIGGIAGLNSDYISRCYNEGEVKATVSLENNSSHLEKINSAGIVASNYGEIKFCYNTGKTIASVLDNLEFDGIASSLVSDNGVQGVNYGEIYSCYTIGELEATDDIDIIHSNSRNCYKLLLFELNM